MKEGFKTQNNFSANTIKGNNQIQQELTNEVQSVPSNQIQQVHAQGQQTQTPLPMLSAQNVPKFPQMILPTNSYQMNQSRPPIFNLQPDLFTMNNMGQNL